MPTNMLENNEETPVEETTASASEEEQTPAEETVETTEETTGVDYKKELEETQTRLGKAEHTIVKEKKERKDAEEKAEGAPTFTLEDVEKVVGDKLQTFHKETRKSDIESKIRSMTGSEDEAKLALLHYQNTITVSGNDTEDVENAILLANKKRYTSSMSEIAASNRSKDTVQTTGGGAGQKVAKEGEKVELSKEDEQVMKSFGLKPEDIKDGGYDRNAAKEKIKAERIASLRKH